MKPLWTPSPERARASNLARFTRFVNERHGLDLGGYDELWAWSTSDLGPFWKAVWDFTGVVRHAEPERLLDDPRRMPGARWFEGARLNFAENLLRWDDERVALTSLAEGRPLERRTYASLRTTVARLAASLREAGVRPGDRVVGWLPNLPETVEAMLAAASVGATWSSCSPDFGTQGVLDRFGQIEPVVLFAADHYVFKGKRVDALARLRELLPKLPSVRTTVVVRYGEGRPELGGLRGAVHWDEFLAPGESEPRFESLPFEHPLYVMYSSGTTGLPKCLVQSAGGVLLQHRKEHVLHCDLRREDELFYFTTCGWMMWNWLVSGLATGAGVVLYDGAPMSPDPGVLWRLAEEAPVTVFGTSARYLAALENEGYRPGARHDLSRLRAVLSTGSPLSPESFRWVYREVKADLQLSSISGGTDLNGCFALGSPTLPVYEGELQCRGLGMKVAAYSEAGRPLVGEKGELVCEAPFPSMPTRFWNDPDGAKYRAAYFERFPGVWAHGDWVLVNERGGVQIFGRSDATLNPGGVRIGTAEIYRVVEGLPEVADSLVVGQDVKGDVRVLLFVKLNEGARLDEALVGRIKAALKEQASPRHVPALVLPVADIPYTLSGKKVELAVRNVIHGLPVKNRDALANPASLDLFKGLPL